jgi:hypothetical protein
LVPIDTSSATSLLNSPEVTPPPSNSEIPTLDVAPPISLIVHHPISLSLSVSTSSTIPPSHHSMVTRSCIGSLKPKDFLDYQLYYTTRYPPVALHTSLSLVEPTCYTKAATDSRWRSAMSKEFDAIMANGTWTLCPHPLHQNAIRNKWVYKIKQHADGSIERFKARLVAEGFDQKCGLDYIETFSPVIKTATI